MWSKSGTGGGGVGRVGVGKGVSEGAGVGLGSGEGVAEGAWVLSAGSGVFTTGDCSSGVGQVGRLHQYSSVESRSPAQAPTARVKANPTSTGSHFFRETFTQATRSPLIRVTGTSITVGLPGTVNSTAKRTTSPCTRSLTKVKGTSTKAV